MGVAAVRGGEGLAVVAGGVEDAVAQMDVEGVLAHLVADDLDGAEDAVLDLEAGGGALQDDAGLLRRVRVALRFQRPAGDESGVP